MSFYSRTCAPKRNANGVTLLELLVTLVLISVVAAFSWPRLTSSFQSAKAKELQLTTVHVLNAARLAALTQGRRVLVCLSDDGLHCATLGQKYWLSVWKAGAEKQTVPLNAKPVQLHWRAMAENQGGILFTPTMVGNGTVWACLAGQARPLWVLSMDRLGGVHARAGADLHCETA
ncbi:MAG TPA: prepilin-type N-terminal cleavage/methylation domain-containing protein [Gammaproteobacteria bacterium]|jgi:prepilin-type N-terminal cleavage/methylation domain-containing protein|nr:prepilin-type N-terminal cleavage/methylation domain-containing protein [Gammaproteobacteria bacterium]